VVGAALDDGGLEVAEVGAVEEVSLVVEQPENVNPRTTAATATAARVTPTREHLRMRRPFVDRDCLFRGSTDRRPAPCHPIE
jgi:hypothetical protein